MTYGYGQFCARFARYQGKVDVVMRQVHQAGEKAFIDYSGKRLCIHDMVTGEVMEVELFVGVLGASNYIFAEATRTQTKQARVNIDYHIDLEGRLYSVPYQRNAQAVC